MADGGGDPGGGDAWWNNPEDFRSESQQRTETIGDQTRVLVNHFITERLKKEHVKTDLSERELFTPGTPTDPQLVGPDCTAIGNSLQIIGDQLDGDRRLQNLIADLPADCPYQTFMEVAKGIFNDGQFNWGRVVMLFYVAFKIAKKALTEVSIIRKVVEWVVGFVKKFVAEWILSRGGWSAIQEYFGSTTGQAIEGHQQSDRQKSRRKMKCHIL